MLDIVKTSQNHNGNGSDAINGRGTLRRKLTPRQRIALGADIALGVAPLAPSLKQSAAAVGISVFELRGRPRSRNSGMPSRLARSSVPGSKRRTQRARRRSGPLVSVTSGMSSPASLADFAYGVVRAQMRG